MGDERCGFDGDGVSDVCWAWAVDEVGELVGVTYGVLDSPLGGGYQLISMPTHSVEGAVLKTFQAISVTTPRPTPTPTPTATPTPENECQCVPHRVVPGRNLAFLKKTASLGKGSTRTKKVGVVLKAREQTRGACRPGSSTDTFSLRLRMVDDDDGVIFDETRDNLTCNRRVRQEKFQVTYDVENCAGSEAPSRRSKGEVTVTATTDDGKLIASRTLKCKE
jgi:hypothetical protein